MTSEGEARDVMQAGDTDGGFLDSFNWDTCSTLAGTHLSRSWKSVLFCFFFWAVHSRLDD